MPYEDVVYKRDELYEKVWSKPVRKVATEYGCSDVALAKMCRRLGVPLPGRGYWARVTAGQKLKRLRLPTLKKDQPSEIHVRRWKGRAERTMTDEVKERLAKERAAEAPIVVPDALPAEPHELVALTLKVLGKQKPKPGPLLDRGERRCLSVSVAPSSLDRALRIVEAVLSALDARGLSVEATKPAPARLDRHGRLEQSAVAGMTRVQIGEEWVPFQLVEQTAPESPPMKRPEWSKAKPEEMTAWYNRGPTKFIATGKLTLQVDVNQYLHLPRRAWNDTQRQRVEDCLNDFIRALILAGEALRLERIRRAEQEQRFKEDERRRLEEQQRRYEQQRKVEALTKELQSWRLARDIREYVADVHRIVTDGHCELKEGGRMHEWVRWCEEYAEEVDPLSPLRHEIAEHAENRRKEGGDASGPSPSDPAAPESAS